MCSLTTSLPSVKQEPEEFEIKKSEAIFKPPPLPEPEVLSDLLHRWSLSKSDELFFMQLPDSLPGQPPTTERRPVKTEVQSEDGQSVLLKMETEVIAVTAACPTQDGSPGICAVWNIHYVLNRKKKLMKTAAIWKTCGTVCWGRCWWGSLVGYSSFWDK